MRIQTGCHPKYDNKPLYSPIFHVAACMFAKNHHNYMQVIKKIEHLFVFQKIQMKLDISLRY